MRQEKMIKFLEEWLLRKAKQSDGVSSSSRPKLEELALASIYLYYFLALTSSKNRLVGGKT